MTPLLSVEGLSVRIGGRDLVAELSFAIGAGERMGLIGESGSGKSVTAMALVGLLPRSMEVSGSVMLDSRQVIGAHDRALTLLRGATAAVIFQEPATALDPLMRIGRQIAE